MPRPTSKIHEKMLKKLGEKVKAIREKNGLTLQEVAGRIDKDRQSIHRLEKGDFNPTLIYLLEVCEGLEVDIIELFSTSE